MLALCVCVGLNVKHGAGSIVFYWFTETKGRRISRSILKKHFKVSVRKLLAGSSIRMNVTQWLKDNTVKVLEWPRVLW